MCSGCRPRRGALRSHERPLSAAANWYYRPEGDIRRPYLAALKLPVARPRFHAQEALLRKAHIGGQPSGRLRRGARLDTVRAYPIGSPSCTPRSPTAAWVRPRTGSRRQARPGRARSRRAQAPSPAAASLSISAVSLAAALIDAATLRSVGAVALDDGLMRCARAAFSDVLNHLKATQVRQSGTLMGVHPARALKLTGGLAIPSLSKPLRMNTRNNLLTLHS